MGTGNGLNLFNKSSEGFLCYKIEDGLPSNSINGILEDSHGNLWLSTNKGLSKFINAINLPAKPEFKNYVYEDGLQSNEFTQRSCYKGADGMLYFGGTNGFNVFDPDKITVNTYIPPIVITGLRIFNKPEIIGERGLNKDIDIAEDLVLSYKQTVLSFDFAALNYISSSKNQYAYKMEGFDNDWNYIGTTHTTTYTNLDPGRYYFKVMGSNNDGVWNEKGVALPIVITPPFWQTLWFKMIVAMVFLGIVFWMYRRWIDARKLAERRRLDEAIAKERNQLRTLIDNMPDYVYMKNTEGRFIVGNSAMGHQLGFATESELLGKNDFDIFPPELAENNIADEQNILQSGKGIYEYEGPAVDANKEEKDRWVSTTKVPLKDTQGEIIGTVGIGRDITARKRAEEERERLIKELQDAVADIKILSGLVPICSNCKKIRDDKGYWTQLEGYIQAHSQAKFSHGVCPE